ncbi:hypothetical protein Z043_123168, partial [Scleropages formosus]
RRRLKRSGSRLRRRFKPLQKVDGMGDGLSGGVQHSAGAAEQSAVAQSQHHQQYIGEHLLREPRELDAANDRLGSGGRFMKPESGGPPDISHALPPFPSLELGAQSLPASISMNDVKKLQGLYRDHCEYGFPEYFERSPGDLLWEEHSRRFLAPHGKGSNQSRRPRGRRGHAFAPKTGNEEEPEGSISRRKLVALCRFEPVAQWMRGCDHVLYQALVEILIPDVLRPVPSQSPPHPSYFASFCISSLPLLRLFPVRRRHVRNEVLCAAALGTLTQAIRNFAKSLEGWLTTAMSGFPLEIVRTKVPCPRATRPAFTAVAVVSAFAQTLRRYTSLNHLAQAARAVLQNTSQINQMLSDLNRVDFANVQEQASWVCQCDEATVQRLEQDFKLTLQQQSSLDQWALWLDNVVNQVLKPHEGSPSFPRAARQFLLKWSFYRKVQQFMIWRKGSSTALASRLCCFLPPAPSSMVIRDLTLRSAASFGSFHLIRLLYDEYMFYLVEHRVAQATGETPIAVMGEVGSDAAEDVSSRAN